jgi:hypothetical protein
VTSVTKDLKYNLNCQVAVFVVTDGYFMYEE